MALFSRYLSKHGPLGQVWIAANNDLNLTKREILEINIPAAVKIIKEGIPTEGNTKKKMPLPLKYLADDINEFQSRLDTTIHTSNIDLPPDRRTAPLSQITHPDKTLNMSTHRDPTLNIIGYPHPSFLLPDPTLTDPESLRSSLSPFTLPLNMLRIPMMEGSEFRDSNYFTRAADDLMNGIPTVFVTPTNDPEEIRCLIEYAHQQEDFYSFMHSTEFYNQRPSEYNHPDSSSLAFQPTTTPEMQEGFEYHEPQAQEESNMIPMFLKDDVTENPSAPKKKKRKRSSHWNKSESSEKGGAIIDTVITLSDQQLSDNLDDTRDIVRQMEANPKIFTSLNNWLDDEFFVPPVEQALDDYDAGLPFDPEEYLESMKSNNTITYNLLRSTHIERSSPQTVHTDSEDALAIASLLTFVHDGYAKSRQDAPYAPIFEEKTDQFDEVEYEKKSTETDILPLEKNQ
ncbi:hypothetical protein BLNAU_10903 [Blattamonas nauphoetae]|uniref:Rad21/Rec8-like protein N-terminal domain-containing protein n=1 Tax=Blattamonas nauphoetae TaxID=2049346 RepID=A0ABQ9XST8_9EUKA|nr:hypothetical protein BLNAU_10903 [Blattamonas nauphoetae]